MADNATKLTSISEIETRSICLNQFEDNFILLNLCVLGTLENVH